MNAAAFFTYIRNFSDLKLPSFMPYTYNMNMNQLKIPDGALTFQLICSLINVCTLNLRPGMNASASFTYTVKFPAF